MKKEEELEEDSEIFKSGEDHERSARSHEPARWSQACGGRLARITQNYQNHPGSRSR